MTPPVSINTNIASPVERAKGSRIDNKEASELLSDLNRYLIALRLDVTRVHSFAGFPPGRRRKTVKSNPTKNGGRGEVFRRADVGDNKIPTLSPQNDGQGEE